jgi:hypothetical protein
VDHSHHQALQTVAAYKEPTGLENAPYLAQQFVLELRRWDMVQHCHRDPAGKPRVRKRHRCRIACDDFDVAAAQARTKSLRQTRIDFDRCDSVHFVGARAQQVRCETGPRSNFQNILSEVGSGQNPRDSLLHGSSPFARTTQPLVDAIHVVSSGELPAS